MIKKGMIVYNLLEIFILYRAIKKTVILQLGLWIMEYPEKTTDKI
jgi:hypothetical protein